MIPNTLRAAADARGFRIGAAADPGLLEMEPEYASTLCGQFNMLTPENVMKSGPIHPASDRYEFGPADALMRFARRHDMQVRGHTLVWHNQMADWLSHRSWTPGEWRSRMEEHIAAVAGRYAGQIAAWDVVNEAIADDGSLRASPWLKGIGPTYLESAFRAAHQADPAARLFYNDYGAEGLGAKSDGVLHLVRKLLDRDVPIHGVGLQMHVELNDYPLPGQVADNMERLGRLGLEVQITELDVRLPQPCSTAALERQAQLYGDILDAGLAAPNCTALTLWGVSDRHSWVPGFFHGWDHALVFDAEYRPKPAYHALLKRLVQAGCKDRPGEQGASPPPS
jgi:endo-1,4-beta-xylanase